QVEPGARERYAKSLGLAPDSIDPDLPSERVLAAAQRAGVATLDPRAALKSAAQDGQPLYFAQDWHVNPRGSRVLGREIYERLAQPEYLGGGTSAAGRAAFAPPAPTRPAWPFVLLGLWLALGWIYSRSYRDENAVVAFAKVGAMIAVVVLIVWGFGHLAELLGPRVG